MTDAAPEDLDAIVAALARLRGRGRGPFGAGGAWGFGGPGGLGGPDGPRGQEQDRNHDHGHGPHDWFRGGGRGGGARGGVAGDAPWAGPGARIGGPARMRLLEALAAASHPLSVSEVGEAIGVDQPRASRLIQQAVELGLVRREADPGDARRTRIALTDDGAKLARGFRGQRREHLSEALADFTTDERAELARLLTKLAEAWPQQ